MLYRTSQLADSRASPFSFAPPDRSGFAKFEIVAMLPQHPYTDIIYGDCAVVKRKFCKPPAAAVDMSACADSIYAYGVRYIAKAIRYICCANKKCTNRSLRSQFELFKSPEAICSFLIRFSEYIESAELTYRVAVRQHIESPARAIYRLEPSAREISLDLIERW